MISFDDLNETVRHARVGGEQHHGRKFKGGQFTPHKVVDGVRIPHENLNIPRHEMPQIRKTEYVNFFNWLRSHGVPVEDAFIRVVNMRPTQGEFNTTKVKAMMQGVTNDNDFAIMSHDNYILDGHHRWLANYNKHPDTEMSVVKIGMPIMPLLDKAKEFPGTTYRKLGESNMLKFSQFSETIKLGAKKRPEGVDKFLDDWHKSTSHHPFDDRARIHGHTSVELSHHDGKIHISDIRTLKPKSGAGTHTLKHLTHLADKHGVELTGTAKAYSNNKDHITKSKRLKDWYVKHGFKAGRGDEHDGYDISYKKKS